MALCTLLWSNAQAGIQEVQQQLSSNQQSVESVSFSGPSGTQSVQLRMPFAKAFTTNKQSLGVLKGKEVQEIRLVYTEYKTAPSFDQQSLNKERLRTLKELAPELFQSNYIRWTLVGQTGDADRESAMEKFHGFIIIYRPDNNKDLMRQELTFLDKLMDFDETTYVPPADRVSDPSDDPTSSSSSGLIQTIVVEREVLRDFGRVNSAYETTVTLRGTEYDKWAYRTWMDGAGDIYDVDTIPFDSVKHLLDNEYAQLIMSNTKMPGMQSRTTEIKNMLGSDTAIYASMTRNPGWKNILVVADVTGSMSPYTGQLFFWLEQNQERIRHYAFFNDGDDKPTDRKSVGSTGGIYHTKSTNIKQVFAKARECMKAGYSNSDIIENNLEAVLDGIKECPECEDIILIADNPATPRDLELVKNLDRPVRIILCGRHNSFNPAYFDLARATGGSLHTVDLDITHLGEIKEGERFVIGNEEFRLQNRRFKHIRFL